MNDVFTVKNEKRKVLYGRIAVLVVGIIICLLCIYQPPQIFWITYLGATIVACSWLPVALASVWSKRVTKTGAFWGMLVGFVVSAVMKIGVSVAGVTLPIYFDPFFVGLAAGIVAMIIGSVLTKVTDKEREEREALFIIPESEKNPDEVKKTKRLIAFSIPMGMIITAVLIIFWVIPYTNGLH